MAKDLRKYKMSDEQIRRLEKSTDRNDRIRLIILLLRANRRSDAYSQYRNVMLHLNSSLDCQAQIREYYAQLDDLCNFAQFSAAEIIPSKLKDILEDYSIFNCSYNLTSSSSREKCRQFSTLIKSPTDKLPLDLNTTVLLGGNFIWALASRTNAAYKNITLRDMSQHASLVSIVGSEVVIQTRPESHYGIFKDHYSYKNIYVGNKSRNSHFSFRCMDTSEIGVVLPSPLGLGTSTNRIPITDEILTDLLEDIKGIIANIAKRPVEVSIDYVTRSNYE